MINVKPMTLSHIEAVHAIECDSFSDPWPIGDILFEIKHEYSIPLVALIGEEVVGYVTMRHVVNEGHICNLAVQENHRNKGVASALVQCLIKNAENRNMMGITLEVRIGNRAAMALYHKFGFKVEGYRRGYYSYPKEDAAIMWKYLMQSDI